MRRAVLIGEKERSETEDALGGSAIGIRDEVGDDVGVGQRRGECVCDALGDEVCRLATIRMIT